MSAACLCQSVTTTLQQPVINNSQTDRSLNSRSAQFNGTANLNERETADALVLGLMIVLVELLLRQLGDGQQQSGSGNGEGNRDDNEGDDAATDGLQLSATDQGYLLTAIGRDPASDVQISRIRDTDTSRTLNVGDDVELQTGGRSETHTITDKEARTFIELRNPPGTVKLPLSSAQQLLLQNRYGLENISIADNNGDTTISIGDFLTGFTGSGAARVQRDIPVDAALIALLNR